MARRRFRGFLLLIVGTALLLAACGGDVASDVAAPADPDPVADTTAATDASVETTSTAAPDEPSEDGGEPDVDDGDDAPAVVEPEPVSYDGSFSQTIQPIFEEKCSSCHYDGGPGAVHWN